MVTKGPIQKEKIRFLIFVVLETKKKSRILPVSIHSKGTKALTEYNGAMGAVACRAHRRGNAARLPEHVRSASGVL